MKSRFASALRAVDKLLARMGVEYVLIGGQAAIFHGSERTTRDVDLAVWVPESRIETLVKRARAGGFEALQDDPVEAARSRRLLILLHSESGVQIDLMVAGSPFEDEVRRRAESARVAGVTMRVIRPDDLLVYKLLAGRDHDLFDAACILEKGTDRLDLVRVRTILGELEEALGRGDLLAALDRLLSALQAPNP